MKRGRKMKSKISILLLLSLLLTACSEAGGEAATGDDSGSNGTISAGDTDNAVKEEEKLCIDQLEFVDFGGISQVRNGS